MNEDENVVYRNELTITFEQMADGTVKWRLLPDELLWRTRAMDLFELAELGAPLSALGIRALLKLCEDGLVFNALEQGNAVRVGLAARRRREDPQLLESVAENVTIN